MTWCSFKKQYNHQSDYLLICFSSTASSGGNGKVCALTRASHQKNIHASARSRTRSSTLAHAHRQAHRARHPSALAGADGIVNTPWPAFFLTQELLRNPHLLSAGMREERVRIWRGAACFRSARISEFKEAREVRAQLFTSSAQVAQTSRQLQHVLHMCSLQVLYRFSKCACNYELLMSK